MKQDELDVFVLKPTAFFLSFLEKHFPTMELPNFAQLQVDNTVYYFSPQQDDEAMLNEIERNFQSMFCYEMSRWVGDDASGQVECSFFDFLCCFKFKLQHRYIKNCLVDDHYEII